MRRIRLLFLLFAVLVSACQSIGHQAAYINASRFADAGQYERAIYEMYAVLRDDPTSVRATVMRANYRKMAGDYDGAAADWSRAIELDPTHAVFYLARADCRMRQASFDALGAERALAAVRRGIAFELTADYTRAIELDPKLSRAYGQRALIWLALGEELSAREDIAAFHKLEPSGPNRKAFDEQIDRLRVIRGTLGPSDR